MSRENLEVVRRVYDAAARRDTAAVLSLYDPDVEWDGTRTRWAEVIPGTSQFRGHEELQKFFRMYYEMWESFEDDVQELIDAGDHHYLRGVQPRTWPGQWRRCRVGRQ